MNARSIPAHAGEPQSSGPSAKATTVYPRPRGGTSPCPHLILPPPGLSPPTRGNLSARRSPQSQTRSIPAHAGEPTATGCLFLSASVYPRPRGGTSPCPHLILPPPGLSPPTRGNPPDLEPAVRDARSIPAHAGEPPMKTAASPTMMVYPRPRGGTGACSAVGFALPGLSPPTRGNLDADAVRHGERRSIPAHAGEPGRADESPARPQVYPRPRGGTDSDGNSEEDNEGLSPPTRGNPPTSCHCCPRERSIPAHAGEPSRWSLAS